jgi:hypothetical protein
MRWVISAGLAVVALLLAAPAQAGTFFFSTGAPNGQMATASRPGPSSGVNQETESADDFILTTNTTINSATFTGLVPAGVNIHTDISQVVVEIYRVFPKDSNVSRTSGPPTFSTPQVPTRVNSPSDVELDDRNSLSGNLSFTTNLINSNFSVPNSVDTNIAVGGGSPATPASGQEVEFDVTFTTPFSLPADHFFFVPQVLLSTGHFLWLSGQRPLTGAGGTTPFTPDLQEWIRNIALEPDWLRVGTDIVGGSPAPTFNSSFSLQGTSQDTPEPSTLALFGLGAAALAAWRWRRKPPRGRP